MKAKLKKAGAWVRYEFLRVEAMVKSMAAVVFGGAVGSVYSLYSAGQGFALTHEHLLKVKASAISGGFVALVAYWQKPPKRADVQTSAGPNPGAGAGQ